MATAKLSGSLLAYKDVPTSESVGRALENHHESTEPIPFSSNNITSGSKSDQEGAALSGAGLASPTNWGNRPFSPTLRYGLAICGIATMTAVGIVLYTHTTGNNIPTIDLQPRPTSLNVPKLTPTAPSLGPSAEMLPAVPGVSHPVISEVMRSPAQPAMTSASLPTAATAPPAAVGSVILSQPEPVAATVASAPVAAATGITLSAEEISALLTRGDALFRNGDIVSARLCYERAAEGGDAQAALRLGETFDPAFLARAHLNGFRSDPTAAARWYRRALELGAAEAKSC